MTKARSNATANAAKGDLTVGTGTNLSGVLSAGNNGEALVLDSSTATGLRYQGSMAAGKNLVINGGMDIWQRGTSLSVAGGAFNIIADRWGSGRAASAGGYTVSRQLTNDTTNLPFIQYCLRIARNSGDTITGGIQTAQSMETVNSIPYAGKTVTISAYIRKGADYSGSTVTLNLATGTGTDQNVNLSYSGYAVAAQASITPTTTWVRYSATTTVASTATELAIFLVQNASGTASTANDYIEITGVQIEVGSVPTQFTRVGGTIQGELAACQRYYLRTTANATYAFIRFGMGTATSTTAAAIQVVLPVTMRSTVTVLGGSNLALYSSGSPIAVTSLGADQMIGQCIAISANVASGLTQDRAYQLIANNSSTAYLELGAEL